MRFEVLTEDRSGGMVLDQILPKMIRKYDMDVDVHIRPHRGLGDWPSNDSEDPQPYASGLLDLLPAKLRAYEHVYAGTETIVIVVMDSDSYSPAQIFNRLRSLCQRNAPNLVYVIGVCVEEMESWLLGDKSAVLAAYPDADVSAINQYEQDSICGTWETLCRVILKDRADRTIRIGYPAVGQLKSEWAENIAVHMNPEVNKSPSFDRFSHAVDYAVKKIKGFHR
ncbi:MAG: DUF4276 family protein [Clostridiaceae bacterium]|nr:DUF4276 family protein [Clostridiaceae bacterium]